jgi:hypothetical protein
MIFILLLVLGCYILHNMCVERGISAWRYLMGFVAGFFLIIIAAAGALVYVYGPNVASDPDIQKKVVIFTGFAAVSHVLLFLFFHYKISRLPNYPDDEDDHRSPPSNGEKKDLSYFR